MQGCQRFRNVGKKPMEKVDAPEEALELHLVSRPGHGSDGLDLGRKRNDAGMIDNMPKIRHSRLCNDAFLPVEVEASVAQAGEDGTKVLEVLLPGGAGDEDVIEIDKNTIQTIKYSVH